MRVRIINKSAATQYVDIVGRGDKDDTVIVGQGATLVVNIATEDQFVQLSKKYRASLVLRKC